MADRSGSPTQALNLAILRRAFSDDELSEIIGRYLDAKLRSGPDRYQPSKEHIALCKKHLKGELTIKEVATAMGMKSTIAVRNRFFVILRDHYEEVRDAMRSTKPKVLKTRK